MSVVEREAGTRYSVRRSRDEIKKERVRRYFLLALICAASVLIVLFAALVALEAAA
jgi:hypothetical protein